MRRFIVFGLSCLLLSGIAILAGAQEPTFTPTPQPVATPTIGPSPIPMDEGCVTSPLEDDNLVINGDFQTGVEFYEGFQPARWSGTGVLIADATKDISESQKRGIVVLHPGMSISQRLAKDDLHVKFKISMCALIEDGQIEVTIDYIKKVFPGVPVEGTQSGKFTSTQFTLDLSSNAQRNIEIRFVGNVNSFGEQTGMAYIDNISVYPSFDPPEEETPEPTGTPTEEPTATPGTPTEVPTPTPTYVAGQSTPTPTPGLTSDSVQLIANPPMISVSPDDFADTSNGTKSQVAMDLQIVGSNGDFIDILAIDPDATIRFEIESGLGREPVGTINQRLQTGDNFETISTRRIKMEDLIQPIYFRPIRPYSGTVRIIVTIEYEAIINGSPKKIKIQGIVPIYMRTDPNASTFSATGMFDPRQNMRLGRMPGDRGVSPDQRTNLLFRERFTNETLGN